MNHILNMNDFLSEKRVTYKRQYTESYPAQQASTAARVRNAVFSAMKDGVITEDELSTILQTAQASPRWVSRNVDLFKITEEEGLRTYRLSGKGSRIFRSTQTT